MNSLLFTKNVSLSEFESTVKAAYSSLKLTFFMCHNKHFLITITAFPSSKWCTVQGCQR